MALTVAGFNVTVYSRTHSHQDKNDIVNAIGARFIPAEKYSVDTWPRRLAPSTSCTKPVGASSVAFDVIPKLGRTPSSSSPCAGRKGPIEVDTDFIMRDVVPQ